MDCKLIACDLDGTLLCDDSGVSDENLQAIHKIKDNHIEFVINTGRTLYEIPDKLLQCPDIRYIIYSDGSAAYDKALDEIIFSHYIDTDTAQKLLHLLNRYDTMVEFYENGHPVTDLKKLNPQAYDYYNIDKNYRPVIDKTRTGVDDLAQYILENSKIELLNIFFREMREREACAETLEKDFDVHFTTSMDNNIEIMAKSVSKGAALKKLCDHLKIEKEKVIAVGDSRNDFTMFDFAKTALAVSNASETVKAYADAVICSNEQHIAKYICEKVTEV